MFSPRPSIKKSQVIWGEAFGDDNGKVDGERLRPKVRPELCFGIKGATKDFGAGRIQEFLLSRRIEDGLAALKLQKTMRHRVLINYQETCGYTRVLIPMVIGSLPGTSILKFSVTSQDDLVITVIETWIRPTPNHDCAPVGFEEIWCTVSACPCFCYLLFKRVSKVDYLSLGVKKYQFPRAPGCQDCCPGLQSGENSEHQPTYVNDEDFLSMHMKEEEGPD